MPNPGTVSQGDIDKLEQGMKDLTSLGQQLSKTFRDINKETDVLSNNFKDIVRQAGLNNNNAERYLISQKLQEATQNRINEIKAKSSYLDSVSLAEVLLKQPAIFLFLANYVVRQSGKLRNQYGQNL